VQPLQRIIAAPYRLVWRNAGCGDLRDTYTALESCEILLIIGTSGIVYPAASFAPVAKAAGAYVIELNLETTPYAGVVDRSFQGRAKDLVPALLK
jgi:NAD-dependent deacetylase